ncbi:hypothetical protein K449DRAFT_438332 [Hypoxylon sp. EC38]|nr:hypothetical protein K449DRAFT_438332 [Hypoxylon sp. EC38]
MWQNTDTITTTYSDVPAPDTALPMTTAAKLGANTPVRVPSKGMHAVARSLARKASSSIIVTGIYCLGRVDVLLNESVMAGTLSAT